MKKYTTLTVIIVWTLVSKAQFPSDVTNGIRFTSNDGIATQRTWLQSGTAISGNTIVVNPSSASIILFDSSKSFYQLGSGSSSGIHLFDFADLRNGNISNSPVLTINKSENNVRLTSSAMSLSQTINWDDILVPYTSNKELKLSSDYFSWITNRSKSIVSNNGSHSSTIAIGSPIHITDAKLLTLNPKMVLSNSEGLLNQLDISKQTFFVDQTLWLEQSYVPGTLSSSSILLHTGRTENNGNGNGIIAITHDADNKFGLILNGDKAIVGWENPLSGGFFLNASSINTDGIINTSNFLTTGSGLMVHDSIASEQVMPESMQGWFISNKTSTGLLIENVSNVSDATAGLFLKQGMYTNFIGTVASGDNALNYPFSGSFLIQSTSPRGLALNATQHNAENNFAISFAVDSKIVAGFDVSGALVIGRGESESSAIVSISSNNKGVLFPRMSSKQRHNIESPQEGLMVFDRDLQKYCFYTKKGWEKITSKRIRL